MFVVMLMLLVHTNYGQGEVHIRGGSLVNYLGKVNLIQNVVIIKKNFTDIQYLQTKAKEVVETIQVVKQTETSTENKEMLERMSELLNELIGSRKKRSLLPFVGNALNQLFGVATENDLNREKERLDKIEHWANNLGNIVTSTVGVLNQHAKTLNNISDTLNSVGEKLEGKIKELDRKLVIQDLTIKAENIMVETKMKMEALLNAHRGIVTVDLISLAELQQVITRSVVNFVMKPLEVDIMSYYSVMNVKVVFNQVYILIPFSSSFDMNMYRIIPFPMFVKDKSVILKGNNEILLEKKNVDLIGIWNEYDLDSCVEIKDMDFVCNHEMFFMQPLVNFPCLNYLLNGGEDGCQYEEFTGDFKVQLVNDKIYVYTRDNEIMNVMCKENEKRITIRNLNVFPRECSLKLISKFYYDPTIFQVLKLNSTFKIVDRDIKVNISHFTLPKLEVKADRVDWENVGFFYVYKEKVMPIMTMTLPLIVLVGIVVFVYVRKMMLRKLRNITKILEVKVQKGDE